MRTRQKTATEILKIESLLQSMGFISQTKFRNIDKPMVQYGSNQWLQVDISATNKTPEDILARVVQVAYETGKRQGERELQCQLREVLGIDTFVERMIKDTNL